MIISARTSRCEIQLVRPFDAQKGPELRADGLMRKINYRSIIQNHTRALCSDNSVRVLTSIEYRVYSIVFAINTIFS